MQENAFIVLSFVFLIEIVTLIEMTNVIVQIANRIQKPSGGAGFCWRWVKMEHDGTKPYFMYVYNKYNKANFFLL